MALQKDEVFHGVFISAAYHKIHSMTGGKDGLGINMRIYKNESVAAANSNDHVTQYSFSIPGAFLVHNGGSGDTNYTKQAYEYMKANVITDSSGETTRDYTTGTVDV